MRQLDLEVAGEFLVMAATLMYIKSRELLPVEQQTEVEEDEKQEDPRWELIRRLVEYKKFKDAAAHLQERESVQENVFARVAGKIEFVREGPAPKPDVSLFDLINAVSAILKRVQQREQTRDVYEDKWTVSDKIDHLVKLVKDRPRLRFSELFADHTTRLEVVTTFLAVLELIRLKILSASQPEPFSEIEITAVVPAAAASHGSAAPPAPAPSTN
jgi:segregation and condensation protein A